MMRLALISAALCAISASRAGAQVVVRQNLDTKGTVAKPGFVRLTSAEGSEDVYTVGVGVRATVVDGAQFSFDLQAEHLRNTATNSEQNHWRAGGGAEWNWGNITVDPIVPFLRLDGRYVTDRIKETEGAQLAASFTTVGVNNSFAPNTMNEIGGGDIARISYSPVLGVSLDWIWGADDPGAEGRIVRGLFQADVAIFPASNTLDDRVEVQLSYAFRKDLDDETNESDDDHPYFESGLNIWAVNSDGTKFGLEFKYVDGEDPTKGFASQEFWSLGLVGSLGG